MQIYSFAMVHICTYLGVQHRCPLQEGAESALPVNTEILWRARGDDDHVLPHSWQQCAGEAALQTASGLALVAYILSGL